MFITMLLRTNMSLDHTWKMRSLLYPSLVCSTNLFVDTHWIQVPTPDSKVNNGSQQSCNPNILETILSNVGILIAIGLVAILTHPNHTQSN